MESNDFSCLENLQKFNKELIEFLNEQASTQHQLFIQLSENIDVARQQLAFATQQLAEVFEVISQQQNDIHTLVASMLQTSEFSNILKGIQIYDDSVEISSEASKALGLLIEYPQEEAQPDKKISFESFLIGIMIPVLLAIASLLQDAYYHRLGALESQKQQLAESEYMKERLELEAEQTQTLKNIDTTLKNIERYLSNSANYHSEHATSSNAALESAVSAPEADDASGNCDGQP